MEELTGERLADILNDVKPADGVAIVGAWLEALAEDYVAWPLIKGSINWAAWWVNKASEYLDMLPQPESKVIPLRADELKVGDVVEEPSSLKWLTVAQIEVRLPGDVAEYRQIAFEGSHLLHSFFPSSIFNVRIKG